MVNGKPSGESFAVEQAEVLKYTPETSSKRSFLQLWVTGRKTGYVEETRKSNSVPVVK
jgi:hypothetical protein